MKAGAGEAFRILLTKFDHARLRAQRLLPNAQQWVQIVDAGLKVLAEQGIHQVFEQGRYT